MFKQKPEMVIMLYGVEIYRGNIVPLVVTIDGNEVFVQQEPKIEVKPEEKL